MHGILGYMDTSEDLFYNEFHWVFLLYFLIIENCQKHGIKIFINSHCVSPFNYFFWLLNNSGRCALVSVAIVTRTPILILIDWGNWFYDSLASLDD